MKRAPELDEGAQYAELLRLARIPEGLASALGVDDALAILQSAGRTRGDALVILKRCCDLMDEHRHAETRWRDRRPVAEATLAQFEADLNVLRDSAARIEDQLGLDDPSAIHLRKRITDREDRLNMGDAAKLKRLVKPGETSDKTFRNGFDDVVQYLVVDQCLIAPDRLTNVQVAKIVHLVLGWCLDPDPQAELRRQHAWEELAEYKAWLAEYEDDHGRIDVDAAVKRMMLANRADTPDEQAKLKDAFSRVSGIAIEKQWPNNWNEAFTRWAREWSEIKAPLAEQISQMTQRRDELKEALDKSQRYTPYSLRYIIKLLSRKYKKRFTKH